jgi:hypothetical protein
MEKTMKLPGNSLGVSDATQFHDCPKLFYRNMARHTRIPGAPDEQLITQNSEILSYGSCVHDAALEVVRNPEIYLDDAVDVAWKKWAAYLQPHHHAELREDVKVIIERTLEAEDTLELVCAEEDWKVPVFVGRGEKDGGIDEVEGEWYYYRFRIDALYRRKDDPTHYVIRDFKTTRRQKFQSDIDSEMQFTAYDFGIREALGDSVETVTIWYDQVKHKEIFSSRTEADRIKFQEYIESTIKAVLDIPAEEMMDTFKINEWCGWCPLLENCAVVDYANDLAKYEISAMSGEDLSSVKDIQPYIERFELAKKSIKVLEEYSDRMSKFIKDMPGTYGNMEYSVSTVRQDKWTARDLYEIIGEDILDMLPLVSKTTISEYIKNPDLVEQLSAVAKQGGYERLNRKPIKEK